MTPWRFGSGWDEEELRVHLKALERSSVNFDAALDEITRDNGWTIDGIQAVIGREPSGPPLPDGHFRRCRQSLLDYEFSDPAIARGHFDPASEFVGRTILLEIKAWGLRFLSGVRVHSMREEVGQDRTVFGFRYDTLEGHIESGFEWFLLEKDHRTGVIHFEIEARWRLGDFPNWWSKLGFRWIGEGYRNRWRRAVVERLARLGEAF